MTKQIPKILFGILVVIGIAVLITFVLDNSGFAPNTGNSMNLFDDSANDGLCSNNLFSGHCYFGWNL